MTHKRCIVQGLTVFVYSVHIPEKPFSAGIIGGKRDASDGVAWRHRVSGVVRTVFSTFPKIYRSRHRTDGESRVLDHPSAEYFGFICLPRKAPNKLTGSEDCPAIQN
jgi:hypothetical protein